MLAVPRSQVKTEGLAACGTWFQVTCPQCQVPLHAKMPTGINPVHCCACKGIFAVQILPPFMPQS